MLCLCVVAFAQDAKLKILDQPLPELPQNHTRLDIQGTIVLHVQFNDFGEIGEVTAVQSLPPVVMEKAVAAARKIKFQPEQKDGKPVTVYKDITYFYSWNGGWRLPTDNTSSVAVPKADPGKADEILQKAVNLLGGSSYLQIKSRSDAASRRIKEVRSPRFKRLPMY